MNKYEQQAREARRRHLRRWSCERKRAYESEEAAAKPGAKVYRCRYCSKWHRSESFTTFVNTLRKR